MDFQEGEILYFDKAQGWTSFNLVAKVRRMLCLKLDIKKLKVGHAGTLDPLATGVLIVCTGKATKRIAELQGQEKEYVATLQLGATTPSFDLEKPVDKTYPTQHITEELVRETLRRFEGEIDQVPPAFSACKVDGHRAYRLAKRGEEVELKPKRITISEIELLEFNPQEMRLSIRVTCSKGTYIRALARDIGTALRSGAYLTALRRTRIGSTRVEECLRIEDFEEYMATNI
ncbi:MAG: tRNA pseudouridine(55) synthase TruB [Prevotellaceae bacterium]|nr:tRNA pseudouridine(55) synthase TruB [Prevotellaceae bacterium]